MPLPNYCGFPDSTSAAVLPSTPALSLVDQYTDATWTGRFHPRRVRQISTHSGVKATGEDRVRTPMGLVECPTIVPGTKLLVETLVIEPQVRRPDRSADQPLMWLPWSKGREGPSRSIHNVR